MNDDPEKKPGSGGGGEEGAPGQVVGESGNIYSNIKVPDSTTGGMTDQIVPGEPIVGPQGE